MPQATGSFEVKRTPQDDLDAGDGAQIGHSRFDKAFSGPLEATGVVHMLSVGTPVQGSAAYVAIERIQGTLDGRRGTFLTQHSGTMERGKPSLRLTVVPDSGTDALLGLSGEMRIEITDGAHRYVFDYALADTRPDA